MIDRSTRLKARRKFRRRRRQVEDLGLQAEDNFEKHFLKRVLRLFDVRRFVIGWIALFVLLSVAVTMQIRGLNGYYQESRPIAGGSYNEGMLGTFTNASPLFATGLVDNSVSRLVFAGLLKYSPDNLLVGDLASTWQVDDTGKIYTITLKPNMKWQDGRDLNASDVVFTFQSIQNPDVKSPLFSAWKDIQIKSTSSNTVTFVLPSKTATFIYQLTTGIVPEHILKDLQPEDFRSSDFNTSKPIGAGPFSWDKIETVNNGKEPSLQHIGLKAFANYNGGSPKLEQFVIKTFVDEDKLVKSFQNREINSIIGVTSTPDQIKNEESINEYTTTLTAENDVFFRNDSDILKDVKVRQALLQSVNTQTVIGSLGYPVVVADSPLLRGQLGYNSTIRQLPFDVAQANKLLDESGWVKSANEAFRSKGKTKLSIKLYAQNNADNTAVTKQLQKAWKAIGVETIVTLPSDVDLQNTIKDREYDALLYGISIGVDPDVFAYWHSSQADPRSASRSNFSDYKSTASDKSLEAGRSRTVPALRAAKYEPFLQNWRTDAPALALYQPRLLYITRGKLFGFNPKTANIAADRFNNVQNWMILQGKTIKSE